MIFSTQRAFTIESNDKSFLEAGIHENVALVNAKRDKSPNGNEFIEFEFNKDGAKLTHTEYEPKKMQGQTDEEFNSKVDNQVARILQILSAWFDKSLLSTFEGDTFDAFANWVIAIMNSADKAKLVRLKVIYGQNGYTSLPKYAKYTFIESMDITSEKSKIKPLGIDTFKRPEIGDKEPVTQTAASTFMSSPIASTPAAPGTDLPF